MLQEKKQKQKGYRVGMPACGTLSFNKRPLHIIQAAFGRGRELLKRSWRKVEIRLLASSAPVHDRDCRRLALIGSLDLLAAKLVVIGVAIRVLVKELVRHRNNQIRRAARLTTSAQAGRVVGSLARVRVTIARAASTARSRAGTRAGTRARRAIIVTVRLPEGPLGNLGVLQKLFKRNGFAPLALCLGNKLIVHLTQLSIVRDFTCTHLTTSVSAAVDAHALEWPMRVRVGRRSSCSRGRKDDSNEEQGDFAEGGHFDGDG